jgi:Flp pilus assembly pilin Flp
MYEQLRRFWREESGQDLIEYSLLITFIAIACMWFVGAGRNAVQGVWGSANATTTAANSTASGT